MQAYELLKSVFPSWTTLTTDAEPCAVCEAMVQMSREDKRGAKIQAEEEKVRPFLSFFIVPLLMDHRRNYDICTTMH